MGNGKPRQLPATLGSCFGKRSHRYLRRAEKIRIEMSIRHNEYFNVYKCKLCGKGYHVGHTPEKRGMKLSTRDREDLIRKFIARRPDGRLFLAQLDQWESEGGR